ncbi:MAG TPA: o-succinylbenzoate synthase [Chryseosolibacter sp.]|nr:o-succinylbenzoate synthase [Chryseosolibacter sp.]
MSLQADFFRKDFKFNFKARTSRGLMADKTSWFISLSDVNNRGTTGWGECGPLKGLSVDYRPDFENVLNRVLKDFSRIDHPTLADIRRIVSPELPSIIFGLETALLDLQNGGQKIIYKNSFLAGARIPINGLIWMGDLDFMMTQINEKIAKGFNCIKLKVGGLDFDSECDILSYIRKRYFRNDIVIRLDANGAFKIDDVLYKLEELAKFNVHSIEQPIKPGLEEMEELCRKTPIPVALDEELIGKHTFEEKAKLLQKIKPQFIILKPSLHGGLQQCAEWIALAQKQNIGWWITSALESSIGLNAICQFTGNYDVTIPQGLGTGTIYQENFQAPLKVENGMIYHDPSETWGPIA